MKESIRLQLDTYQPDALRSDRDSTADVELNELQSWLDESAENREVLQRLESLDHAINVAMHDVEVPADLAAGIRQAVQNVGDSEFSDVNNDAELLAAAIDDDGRLSPIHREELACIFDSNEIDPVQSVSSEASEIKTRRTFMAIATVATIAAAVMLGVFFSGLLSGSGELISAHQLCREAATWDPNSTGGEWIQDISAAPTNYPVSDRLNVSASQWKPFANRYDSKSVVYDMTPPGGTQIFLFAIRPGDQFDVPATFPAAPIYSVDGFSIGTCQRDGVTYVLLVEGDNDRYRKVVKSFGEFV